MQKPADYLTNWINRTTKDWVQTIPTRDLQAELEHWQFLTLDSKTESDREFCALRTRDIADELGRRARILRLHPNNEYGLKMPKRDRSIKPRIEAVKERWPIDQFCTALLGLQMQRFGPRLKSPCPLPGHNEKTASFVIYEDDHFHCFGCHAHGDIFDLTRAVLGIERFTEILERLERESGIAA